MKCKTACVLLLLAALLPALAAQAQPVSVQELVRKALRSYNYTGVLELAEKIASLGSRAPGYPGYERTVNLIIEGARSLNLSVYVQNFTILAPVEREAYVELLEPEPLKLKAYTLWPNGGIASGAGLQEGYAVYVGRGELDDFNGKPVNGSIVVMDYGGSGDNWLHAMRFGAKAVVYLAVGEAENEALKKFDPVIPIPFMRLLLGPVESARLKEFLGRGPVKVRVYTDMELREVEGRNVLVEVPGTAAPNEVMLFVTHFDSWCVAPGLASSTEEALSTAALMELMRYLAENRPSRTAWFLYTSGHWNGLVGPREFVRNYILARPELTRGERLIWQVMGLDISVDLPLVSLIYVGHFYQVGRPFITTKLYWVQGLAASYSPLVSEYLSEAGVPESPALRAVISNLSGPIRFQDLAHGPDLMWSSTMSKPYVLDTEPFTMAGMAAFTLRTSFSYRPLEGEPVNDLDYVRARFRDRAVPQLASAVALAVGLLNEPEVRVAKSLIMPTRLHPLLYWGFIDLEVKVHQYNIAKGWYDPVPNAIVRVSRWSSYPFAWMFAKADRNGTALVFGITPQGLNTWFADAYLPINESWMVMPAWGLRSGGAASGINALVPKVHVIVQVQPLEVRVLLDLHNPRVMRRTIEDPRYWSANVWAWGSLWVSQFESETGMVPLYYYATVFDRRGTGLTGSILVERLTFRLDAGERWALGVVQGSKRVLTVFDYISSLHTLVSERYSLLSSREVRRLSGDLMLEYSETHMAAVQEALREHRYGDAYRNALAAWSYAARAYADETMPLYDESIRSAVTMVPFLAIAAYFLERLLLKGEGFRMIFNLLLLEVAMFASFALVHPAFWIVPSTLLAALGIGLLVLMGVVLWVFYREARDIASEVAAKLLGRHEVISEKTAATLMAMSLSTENMRKRPLRTVLTIVPLIVFSMALVSLASLSPYTAAVASPVSEARAPYYGVLVKRMFGVLSDALDYPSLELLRAVVGNHGSVNPRIWYYPPSLIGMGPYGLLISGNSTARVAAVLGLTPSEAAILLSKGIIEGFTEPFFSEDQLAVVLPATLARSLGVGVGDEVEFQGMKLVVTAIISETTMAAIRDFDGGGLAPIDPVFYGQLNGFSVPLGGAVTPQPLSWSRLIIVPSGIARRLGGFVSSAGVILDKSLPQQEAEKLAQRLAHSIMMTCYLSSKDGSVLAYTRLPTYAAIGWEMMTTPFILTALSIVVSLLGSVKERSREVFTYSSVGLSPSGAMLMFLTEFAVYGFLGATIGYFLGWASSKVFRVSGILPPEFVFNYASIAITLVMTLVLLSTLVAAAYPAYLASKIVTPSLERRWKVARAPRGSIWELPLPFRIPTEREVQALLFYMQEYYTGAGYEKKLFKVSAEPKVNLHEKRLTFNVRLYPYDTGTEQEVNLYFVKEKIGGWRAGVNLRLLKGLGGVWTGASQYAFLDDFRKQLLLWGTLPSAERVKYFRMAEGQLSKESVMSSGSVSGEREPKS